jgi:outer membrane protein assembly factor BamB
MFEQQESLPWYRSLAGLIAASVILPPAGLLLLWTRRNTAMRSRIIGTLCIALLAGGYVFLYVTWRRSGSEAHYTELEQNRAQQKAEAAKTDQPAAQASTAPLQSPSPSGSASPLANGQTAVASAVSPTAAAHASRNYWTNFRGPNRDGRYDEMPVLTSWPAQGLPALWKEPVGLGYASFTIADGRAYTIEQRRRQEVAAAYDINTGRELWTQSWNAEYSDSTGDGPRTTPTWDDGRLYALGATGELRCLDAKTGAVIWGKNILADNQATNLQWAMAASPLIVDDKVIVLPGGTTGKAVVAYNKMTGTSIWKSQNDQAAYVSPMLVTLSGRRQILVEMAGRVFGLAPEDGSLLWSQTWDTDMGINVSQPIIVDKNRFFLSSGYGKGAALVEITGSGKSFAVRSIWENVNMKNKFNSSVLHDGFVYGLDEGILSCVDVNTGERKWKGGRYGYGQVILASGNLIVMSDTGELALVKAVPSGYSEVARFSALEGKTWNYPAIAGGRLFVRNANQMAAYNIAAQ